MVKKPTGPVKQLLYGHSREIKKDF